MIKIFSKKADIAEYLGRSRDDRKAIDRLIQSGEILVLEDESGNKFYSDKKMIMEDLIVESEARLEVYRKEIADVE